MWRKILRIASLCGAVTAGLAAVAFAGVYHLGSDFSTTQNPNGVWSYNQGGTPISMQMDGSGIGLSYLVGWGYDSGMDSSITQVTAAPDPFWHDLQAGDVVVHTASYGGGDMSITWTSPGVGKIDVAGSAWDAYFDPGRDSSWRLFVGGTLVAERDTIYGTYRTDTTASFANNLLGGQQLTGISVVAGDVLEFLPVKTPTSPYGHFMGVDLNVDFTPIPEPASFAAVAGIGLLAFAAARRLKRKA